MGDSNPRPLRCERSALTSWANHPCAIDKWYYKGFRRICQAPGTIFICSFSKACFSRQEGPLYPQHIGEGTPAERLDLGCYSAHIFSRSVVIHGTILRRRTPSMLLSGTQFSPSRIGAARTVCRPAVVIQRIISSGRSHRDFHGRVVIPHTFCSFAPPCPVLLFRTHFIPENNAVVIGSTIQPCWISVFCDFLYCYSAHILQFVEFRQGCYPQHNS